MPARLSVAALLLALVILQVDVSWAQDQESSSASQQDCQAHPEVAGCQQPSKPSPTPKSETPTSSQQPPNLSPAPSVTSGPEAAPEAGKAGRPTTQRPLQELQLQPEMRPLPELPPPPPTEFQLMVADSVGKCYRFTAPACFASAEHVCAGGKRAGSGGLCGWTWRRALCPVMGTAQR